MKKLLFSLIAVLIVFSCKKGTDKYLTEHHVDDNGIEYQTVTNDPANVRMYTLKNGLTVYLSKNTDEPKIQTLISVRAGSVYDPADNTGLAHYLEHMLFKGTDKIGTTDWEKESSYLEQISQLFEEHKMAKTKEEKKEIYKKIDELSSEASKISIANEYDKATSDIGAEGTNAHTSNEETIYKNVIPSNELDKWLKLESERFSKLVLRLFHTELEIVYEEYNRSQDNGHRRVLKAIKETLFPNHQYGQQTTIGRPEHLKNPSMVAIHEYFNKYYVPSNIALTLVGDLDFDETIQKVNDTFGKFENKDVKHPERPVEKPLTENIKKEIWDLEKESVFINYRTPGVKSKDIFYLYLIDMILSNSKVGLIDLNLRQKQKLISAYSYLNILNDYGIMTIVGEPKEGQTLEEVKALLLEQIELIKKGDFDDWIIEAIVNNERLRRIEYFEDKTRLANLISSSFINFLDWNYELSSLDELEKISKEELVKFANTFFENKYVEVYKRQGENKDLVRLEKPEISSIELNRDKQSDYLKDFQQISSEPVQPVFVDYKKAIQHTNTKSGLDVSYIKNDRSDIASINILFDMGGKNIKKLPLALEYFKYLGTDKYSIEELNKELYKIGVSASVTAGEETSYIGVKGLGKNIKKGLKILEHWIDSVKVDVDVYKKLVERKIKMRENLKKNPSAILYGGLLNYSLYGEKSPLREGLSNAELMEINPQELIDLIKDFKNYKQRVFYYGNNVEEAVACIDELHTIKQPLKEYPEKVDYNYIDSAKNIYFVDYDMVQAQVLFIAKGDVFDPNRLAISGLYNTYFGSGLSSIVFQEMREARSLAYSAQAVYSNNSKQGKNDYTYAFVGTQASKLKEAIDVMKSLLKTEMPRNEQQFNMAKESIAKSIATKRIIKSAIFWNYESLKKKGLDYDVRKDVYENTKKLTIDDLAKFYNDNIKSKEYNILIIANKKHIDINLLKKLGNFKEMDVDYLFNF